MKNKLNLIIAIGSVLLLASSCGDTIPMNKLPDVNRSPYILNKIEKTDTKGVCRYIIKTGVDHIYYIDNVIFLDSIGKFRIGDTIYFTANKR